MKKMILSACLLAAGSAVNGQTSAESAGKCPVDHGNMSSAHLPTGNPSMNSARTNEDWWPNRLKLDILRQQSELSNPMGTAFNYRHAFTQLEYDSLKADIRKIMTESQEWWPADFGNYGPFFIRMAWHSAGTYRSADGRGGASEGQQRFAPLDSWPDNTSLDKARRLLWPVKQKYGEKISWADLIVLTGNVALESMGFQTIGFAGGRTDTWEPQIDVNWGSEAIWLAHRSPEALANTPLSATEMGLIYVNPEGPDRNHDPLIAAQAIRETFGRMGMNDEETVALIAGGHTLGKTHGAGPATNVGPEPEAAPIEQQGLGWKSTYKSGTGTDAITSGLEVTWTASPTEWTHQFFLFLFNNEWELTQSPAGAYQWVARDGKEVVPDAFKADTYHKPTMLTTDLSLRYDPVYEKISRNFMEHPEEFDKAFAKAWFKLTHRDMGPKSLYLGPEVPKDDFIWQDPLPTVNYQVIDAADIAALKTKILNSGLTNAELIETAWASASTFRGSDNRGGANGARIRLEPQKSWEANNPKQLEKVLKVYEKIQKEFNAKAGKKQVSLADLIVLGGTAAIEKAAKEAGYKGEVSFTPGRVDATQEQTDVNGFAVLEPMADGFRNYAKSNHTGSQEELLVDKAQLLTLTAPEMTVLYGGLRVLDINTDDSKKGVFTATPGKLSTDFFVNVLDMKYRWEPADGSKELFNVIDRASGKVVYMASRTDLVFGSNSELRALAEVYASDDAQQKFLTDFIAVWTKVMNLDRFDLLK